MRTGAVGLQVIFLEACVLGSKRPRRFAIWPLNQAAPSGAIIGSCGREPGVGTSHSLIATSVLPGTMTAGGKGLAEVLRQIIRDGLELIGRNCRADIDHHVQHRVPLGFAVARIGDLAQRMTGGAGIGDDVFSRPVRQARGGILRPRGKGGEQQGYDEEE